MPNDTSTGGPLLPYPIIPTNDQELEDIFQPVIVGVTGMLADLVRPNYQYELPNAPDGNDPDWASFRVSIESMDNDAHERHRHELQEHGASEVERDELLSVLVSFYGPNSKRNASLWWNGLAIDQNRWPLYQHGIKLVALGRPLTIPALLKERWQRRVDLESQFSRRTRLVYPIRTATGVDVVIDNERYITNVQVRND